MQRRLHVLQLVTGLPGNGTTPPTTWGASSCLRPPVGHEQRSAVGGAVLTRIRTTNSRFTLHTHTHPSGPSVTMETGCWGSGSSSLIWRHIGSMHQRHSCWRQAARLLVLDCCCDVSATLRSGGGASVCWALVCDLLVDLLSSWLHGSCPQPINPTCCELRPRL